MVLVILPDGKVVRRPEPRQPPGESRVRHRSESARLGSHLPLSPAWPLTRWALPASEHGNCSRTRHALSNR
jgi:hypothetical protein